MTIQESRKYLKVFHLSGFSSVQVYYTYSGRWLQSVLLFLFTYLDPADEREAGVLLPAGSDMSTNWPSSLLGPKNQNNDWGGVKTVLHVEESALKTCCGFL